MDSLMRFFQEFLAITDVGVTSPCLSIQALSSTELTLLNSIFAPMPESSRRNADAFHSTLYPNSRNRCSL